MSKNINTEIYLVLYSESQNAFHIDTLKDYCRDNITHLKNGHKSDYLPLYRSESKGEVRGFLKRAKIAREKGSKEFMYFLRSVKH